MMEERAKPQMQAGPFGRLTGWFSKKLKNKMIAWFLIVSLVPVLSISYYISKTSSAELIKKQSESYEKLVVSTATLIDQYISERMAEVKILASTTDIRSNDAAAKTKFIKNFTESTKVFDGNTFISPNGIVTADTIEASVGVNLGERPFFKNGLQGKSTYTEVLLAKTTGKRSIIVATPVKDANDAVIGVLTGLVNFEGFMDKYVKPLMINDGEGYPIVVDSNGIIQLHPVKELVGKSVADSGISPLLADILKVGNKQAGSTTYTDGGKTYMVAYSTIPQTGYGLYLHLPVKTITAEASKIEQNVLIILLIVIALVVVVAYFLGRQISRPIAEMAAVTKRVADGNLKVEPLPIRTQDEVGQLAQSVNTMVESLHTFVSQVTLTAEEVAASAEQLSVNAGETSKATQLIALTIEQMADGTERQMQGVEASVNAITEVANGVQQVAANAQQVTDSSQHTLQAATEGNQAIQTVTKQMQSINTTVNEIAANISSLGARSTEIENIAKVISGIATQTNLLSLNAAIEAARAGEHGRGFAVVANEIRQLAEQSSQSAAQIGELISTIQNETQNAVGSMEQGTKEVSLGIEVVNEAGKSFDLIRESINQVTNQIQNVTEYARQMQSSTGEAVELVSEISEVARQSADGTQNISASTQEQLASIEEVTSSSESLAKMAEDLQSIVKEFKL
ncbi:methyl-accepting chemotaxis protein [Paenibacillus tyrfis]|nr:methyl-accepting chemotaxis protein [Paenibacillus tyrfis]